VFAYKTNFRQKECEMDIFISLGVFFLGLGVLLAGLASMYYAYAKSSQDK
jgi:hypothetical protein